MRSSTLFSMGLLALSVSMGVVGCGDDDDDDTTSSAGKGGTTSTAGKGGSSGSNSTAGKGGSNGTAGKGGTNGGGGDDGNAGQAGGGAAPVGGESPGGNGAGGAAGGDTGGQTGEGGGGGETQAAADLNVNDAGFLTDEAGFVLYTRDGDTVSATEPDSTCASGCPGWPAFAAENPTVSAELDASDFLFFDGSLGEQTAYKGAPLYNFVGDVAPGQTNGNAGIWHAVKIVL
jgi:predicted lipoprotein with Yx(FWY)xxD motif